jgi:3-hydroxyisobutyrate dehydrogenase-like beta-hydroxyacid dehydrogenase
LTEQRPRIGFVGLGIMGSRMARHFLDKGFPLTVWNRTVEKTASLVRQGAAVAHSPADVAARSDFMLTCLADPEALHAVASASDGLLGGAHRGLRWIETSTIGAQTSIELGELARRHGVDYLEAPVSGSRNAAENGSLLVMTGGPEPLHQVCEPVLSTFARRVIHVGPLGSAAVMKLVSNALIAFMLEGLAEGLVLGTRAGISPDTILEVVQASMFASPFFAFKGGAMARREFDDVHFTLDLLHKDLKLALAEGAAHDVPLAGLSSIHQVVSVGRLLTLGGGVG